MLFSPSQDDVRRFFCDTRAKQRRGTVLTPIETVAAQWIADHPEYHAELDDIDAALAARYRVEDGRTNPFLHLSMHLSISEQLAIDQPPGIRAAFERLATRLQSAHEAQHELMECLGQTIWASQRNSLPPDGQAYIDCVQRRASRR